MKVASLKISSFEREKCFYCQVDSIDATRLKL